MHCQLQFSNTQDEALVSSNLVLPLARSYADAPRPKAEKSLTAQHAVSPR